MGAPRGQAESVAEAIIRHQDPVETGTITTVGLLVQLATQFGGFCMSRVDLGLGCGLEREAVAGREG